MSTPSLDFSKPIPLFPLPNCVLFPGVVQPLHIFEPRYKKMFEDTLSDQSAIALALLKPGWEQEYYGAPAIHTLVCVGQIVAHEKVEDAGGVKYNLLLHGITRANILAESKQPGSLPGEVYRIAYVDPVTDVSPSAGPSHIATQRKVLHDLFTRTALKDLTVAQSLEALFDDSVTTDRLIDVLAYTLVQDIPTKQRLLEQLDPVKRGELLLRELVSLAAILDAQPKSEGVAASSSWPPPLNSN